jgi:hypothetical protein
MSGTIDSCHLRSLRPSTISGLSIGCQAGQRQSGSCCAMVSPQRARSLRTLALGPKTTAYSKRPKGWEMHATHKE